MTIDEGTEVYNSVLNLTINFTSIAYADSYDTNPSGFIYFDSLRSSDATTNTLTFTTTEEDAYINGVPLLYSSNSLTFNVITSNLNEGVLTTAEFNVSGCNIKKITYITSAGTQTTPSFSCQESTLVTTLTNINVTAGYGNNITIEYLGGGGNNNLFCEIAPQDYLSFFYSVLTFTSIIGIIFGVLIIIGLVRKIDLEKENTGSLKFLSKTPAMVITLVSVIILVTIAILIIGSLLNVLC